MPTPEEVTRALIDAFGVGYEGAEGVTPFDNWSCSAPIPHDTMLGPGVILLIEGEMYVVKAVHAGPAPAPDDTTETKEPTT